MTGATTDERMMARALKLAAHGLNTTDPNPRVGCVIARGEEIVGEGFHERAGGPHAEVAALAAAGNRADGATAYVTLEPCCHHGRTPPCADALLAAGVARVVYAVGDPNPRVAGGGAARLREAGIEVDGGLLESSARVLNAGFLSRMERGRPWVRLKLACSLDGRTALACGESRWITSQAARQDVQRLRARASVLLTGIGTVLADDPRLDVRLPRATRQPLRVVLDPRLEISPAARIVAPPGRLMVLTSHDAPQRADVLRSAGARVDLLPGAPGASGGLDLDAVMAHLARLEVNEVHAECGATLAGALLAADLVDELVVYVAPVLLGETARPLASIGELDSMNQRQRFELLSQRRVGPDLRLVLRPIAAGSD